MNREASLSVSTKDIDWAKTGWMLFVVAVTALAWPAGVLLIGVTALLDFRIRGAAGEPAEEEQVMRSTGAMEWVKVR